MSITVTISKARDAIIRTIKAQLVPMLLGSPGAGKSALVHQIANEFNLKVIDVRLAQCDPTDLSGFPHINAETGKAHYMPMSTFPIEGDKIPNGYSGWLLFLDEFNSADRSVQKAAYKLVLDKMVGEHHLHKNVAIVCAGNLDTDNAIVEDLSTALQSRLIHLELQVDHDEWLEWAMDSEIDHRITSFIKFKPGNLYRFNPDHEDKTYPAPRTWAFLSRLIKDEDEIHHDLMPLMAGTISEGMAREFFGYTKIYKDLLTIPQIVAKPDGVAVPTEPSVQYALTGAIAHNATTHNIKELMQFLVRIPKEFQVLCLREMGRRQKPLMTAPAVQEWVRTNATELFG